MRTTSYWCDTIGIEIVWKVIRRDSGGFGDRRRQRLLGLNFLPFWVHNVTNPKLTSSAPIRAFTAKPITLRLRTPLVGIYGCYGP
ncbi:hypothetical protein L1987_22398 [Smallanthus sonchifolius]|uniref:Uncharacterized protein n=1 Tax=Smallanthus sonchifolius TaxID=185202 RepID=A0ACB9IG75_9ASTR|nr:hypothetical protein L1987_22398 [Smallanthus sonchifolius]